MRQLLRAGTLLIWGLFLGWMWISGHAANYIGSRTGWVIPLGAVTLRRRKSVAAMRLHRPGHAYQHEYSPHLYILFVPDRT